MELSGGGDQILMAPDDTLRLSVDYLLFRSELKISVGDKNSPEVSSLSILEDYVLH